MKIQKFDIPKAPYAIALDWRASDQFHDTEKLDGKFTMMNLSHDGTLVCVAASHESASNPYVPSGIATLAGEKLPDSRFFAFDIAFYAGGDVRLSPLKARLEILDSITPEFDLLRPRTRPSTMSPGDFLKSVVEHNGEGMVRAELNSRFGQGLTAAKRRENFLVRVTAIHSQSISFEEVRDSVIRRRQALAASNGRHVLREVAGKCPLRMSKIEKVRIGSVLKLTGYGVSAQGAIREPQPDKDTPTSWLIHY